MRFLGAASRAVAPEAEQAKVVEPVASTSKMAPMHTPNPPVALKTIPKTEPKVLKPPLKGKKATKVHVFSPNSLSAVQLPSTMSLTRTRDQGVDPMTTTSSTVDLTDTRATAGSHTSSAEDETHTTARVRTAGTSSMFLTASKGILTGNPCASSTRKKDNVNGELFIQATRGNRDDSPVPSEGEEVISPEQLRFTAARQDVILPKLWILPRTSVYRGSKEGSIDGWILVMRRYLQRTQAKATPDDRAWIIIGHLEGEARNYIITRPSPKRTPRKKCSNYWLVYLELEATVCK